MGLKPKDKNISEIFENIDYEIDFYQREYKWNDDGKYKPIESLMDDIFYRFDMDYRKNLPASDEDELIKELEEFEWYYLNSFMINSNHGKKFIVDGQQRLTTLTLININLYHIAKECGLPEYLIESIKNSIHKSTDIGRSFCMGVKDRKGIIEHLFNHELKEYNNGVYKNNSEKNIYNNYENISKILRRHLILSDTKETKHKLNFFIFYFRRKIYLIEIEIEKYQDVPMIFEVINDRGVPLQPYEIFKGKLLGQIEKECVSNYLNIWEKNISALTEAVKNNEYKIDEFFQFYFRGKYADTPSQYKELDASKYHRLIFRDNYNKKISLNKNMPAVKTFIDKIFCYYCDKYLFTLSKSSVYDEDYKSIYFNSCLNELDGHYPLMLSSLTIDDPDEDKKIKLVSKLFDRNFVILNLTDSYRSNNFNDSVINLVKEIRDKDTSMIKKYFDSELLRNIAQSKRLKFLEYPFKYEFFRNIGYRTSGINSKFLKMFFARIDHYISSNSGLSVLPYEKLVRGNRRSKDFHHIDHILTDRKENLMLFKEDEEKFNLQRNRLGGLVLLKGRDNLSSNDELYQDKLKTYTNSGTLYAQTLCKDTYKSNTGFTSFIANEKLNFKSYDEYGEDEIEERHKLLFEIVKKIWDVEMDKNIDFDELFKK